MPLPAIPIKQSLTATPVSLIFNDVTTGSMYGVILDSQSITASELQDVYDEVAALKESVTEKNVYSEKDVSNRVFLNINIFYYVSKINCRKILALVS